MKETQMPPVHAVNLVANSGNTACRVESIDILSSSCEIDLTYCKIGLLWVP